MESIRNHILVLLFCLLSHCVIGQELGSMHVQNFSPREFKGAPQTWEAIQAASGILYFANTGGVLEYDGTRWRKIPVGQGSSAGAIFEDKNHRIFVGSATEIGYLEPNSVGKMEFKSLTPLIDSTHRQFSSVRGIYQLNDDIIFVTVKEIFIYHPKTASVDCLVAPQLFSGHFVFQEQLYIRDAEEGLLIWDGKRSFLKAPASEYFIKYDFKAAYSLENEVIIGGTGQIFSYRPSNTGKIQPIPLEDQALIEKYRLYHISISPKGDITIGLSGGGVLIIDREGKTKKLISKLEGLSSSDVLGTFYDQQQSLWILTGDHIARVEAYEPITYWNSTNGLDGVVIDALRYKGRMYFTTLTSAYYLDGNHIQHIEEMSFVQHWNMLHYENTRKSLLLIGSHEGVWEFNGHQKKTLISKGIHAMSLSQSKQNKNHIFIGWGDGFAALRYENNQWKDEGRVLNFEDEIRSIEEDEEGTIWLGTFRHGIVKIVPSDNWQSPKEIRYYQEKDGLPSLKNVMVFRFKDELVFGTEKGFYQYEKATDRFVPDCRFGERFCKKDYEVYGFSETLDGNALICGLTTAQSPLGESIIRADTVLWETAPFRKIPDMFAISIYQETTGISWVLGSEGAFRYDPTIEKAYHTNYPTLIRQINLNEDSVIYWGHAEAPNVQQQAALVLPYADNSPTFFYSSPDYESSGKKQYQHWLVGYEKAWSHWAEDTKKEYTNLPEGDYEFKVRARNIYGKETVPATYLFTVKPPFYRTYFAYFVYIVGFISLIIIAVYLNSKRLEREKKRLSTLVAARTAELESQKEEIRSQAESLQKANNKVTATKEELETVFERVRLLSELGQELNATFDLEKILSSVHTYVDRFMDTSGFAIGICEEQEGSIYYQLAVENGIRLKPFARKMKEKNQFAVWCIEHKEPIIIHDVAAEYHRYIDTYSPEASRTVSGEQLHSLIYYPLLIHDEVLGVLTVQSHHAHAYSDNELDVLSNLASYVATSVNNANAYHIIEDKNEDITASIQYANTIQRAILPNAEVFKKAFNEFFIFYRPKDIVSGDFYWLVHLDPTDRKWRGRIQHPMTFVAVVDCTGHGVPGAFMSMIGNTLLNEIIIQNRVLDPAKILEQLDSRVKEVLHQNEKANNDGMEVGLCLVENLDNEQFNLTFTGAKRSFYYWQAEDESFHTVEGCRRAIGGVFSNEKPFVSFKVTLQKGDTFYLASDGLADQNRLGSTRKFGSKRFKAFFAKFSHMPMSDIDHKLTTVYNDFTNGSVQRDDITVIGIRL